MLVGGQTGDACDKWLDECEAENQCSFSGGSASIDLQMKYGIPVDVILAEDNARMVKRAVHKELHHVKTSIVCLQQTTCTASQMRLVPILEATMYAFIMRALKAMGIWLKIRLSEWCF